MTMQAKKYLICAFALALTACGHGDAPADTDADATVAAAPTPAPVAPPAAPAPAPAANPARPLETSDLDAYVKGMHKEMDLLKAVNDKAAKARAAHDEETETEALMEATSVDIEEAGAAAAGMDRARYEYVKNAIDKALNLASMQVAMAKERAAAGADAPAPSPTMQVPDPYAGLDSEVVSALKARASELDQLRVGELAIRMQMIGS